MTSQLKLLYAEDDELIRNAYNKYFKSIFTTVHLASDGKEAFELYLKYKPNILLFDINMPHLNGLEVIEKIRAIDTKTKIVVLTAHKDEEKLLKAIPLGISHYLLKPVKKRELDNVLNSLKTELELKNSSLLKLSSELYWDKKASLLFENDKILHLTKNEISLMKILSSNTKQYYSLDDILEGFWQHSTQRDMTDSSIRNIIKRLKQKLPSGIIENQYALGYKLSTYP